MDDHADDTGPSLDDLHAQLARMPIVEVIGVVAASGAGGLKLQGDSRWTFGFSLAAWRVAGEPVQKIPLYVRKQVTSKQMDALSEQIHPNTVIKIRARLAVENVYGSPQAKLREVLGLDTSDADLQACLAELQKPVYHEDAFFGRFTMDRTFDDRCFWSTDSRWLEQPMTLNLWLLDGPLGLAKVIETARSIWQDAERWDRQIRNCAEQELLPLKSENWQEEDGSIVTAEEFQRRMTLEAITLHDDGSFDVTFNDGNLFFGHQIVVDCSLEEGATAANIQG
jgi:hypothetical protein